MRIGFWSPMHGCGATAGIIAAAVGLALSGKKIILTQTQYCMNNLEIPMLPRGEGEERLENTGLDALARSFKTDRITREQFDRYSLPLNENLVLLPGGMNRCRDLYDNRVFKNIELHIMAEAEKYCDHLMVEYNPGHSERSVAHIDTADVLVICIRQNTRMLDELERWGVPSGKKKTLFLVGLYDEKSRFTVNYLRRRYDFLKKTETYTLPYLSDYMDAFNECRVVPFLQEGTGCTWKGNEAAFFEAIAAFVAGIGGCICSC